MMGWGGGGGGFWAFPLLMGAFWLGLIALIVWLVVKLLPSSNKPAAQAPPALPGAPQETPEAILDRMFAVGEIDEQTYRARRTALSEMRKQQ